MNHPNSIYEAKVKSYKKHIGILKKQLVILSTLRLLVFVAAAAGIYFTFNTLWLAVVISILGISLFAISISKFTDKKSELELNKALLQINEEELLIGDGKYAFRPNGNQFHDPKHFYSYDVDLFGEGSFYQYANRTSLSEGAQKLATLLKANDTARILDKQDAVKELSENIDWLQLYAAKGKLIETETSASQIINWLKSHKRFTPSYALSLSIGFALASVLLLVLTILEFMPISFFGYWLFIGLGITGVYLKKINVLSANCDKVKDTFKQYATLLEQIEQQQFISELLKEKQRQIESKTQKASEIFKQFSKYLDALDNRNNLIGAIFGNGYLLTDIRNSYRIENWIEAHADKVEDWFDVVTFFDAFNSLGTYAFNHQKFSYPEIVELQATINAKDLGHPMLHENKRITSDVLIGNQQFFIVTGANMAGKSTFLRTISLHIIMANVGLPVCASSSKYSPVKLITSMRTSDSLTDDSSYFFSELTRLKFIVDIIEKEPYFIILDEILKGTNSTDKAIGSRKFVEKLVNGHATGIIATHDLSLCEIAEELEEVKNYYFDAEIVNDELYFDYKLKKGICQNMNASFLLKKMEIV
ncbi:MAG: MutS family DNA mismatch repair protein [Winogradskyella sp.]